MSSRKTPKTKARIFAGGSGTVPLWEFLPPLTMAAAGVTLAANALVKKAFLPRAVKFALAAYPVASMTVLYAISSPMKTFASDMRKYDILDLRRAHGPRARPPYTARSAILFGIVLGVFASPWQLVWRWATHRWRVHPDLVLGGVLKSGTTSLAAMLKRAGLQGPYAFVNAQHIVGGKESGFWYGAYSRMVNPDEHGWRIAFPLARQRGRRLVFDAEPTACVLPYAAKAIARALGARARIVLVLREPVDRMLSWARMMAQQQTEVVGLSLSQDELVARFRRMVAVSDSADMAAAWRELAEWPATGPGPSIGQVEFAVMYGLVQASSYYDRVMFLIDRCRLRKEQILIVSMTDFREQPAATMERVLRHACVEDPGDPRTHFASHWVPGMADDAFWDVGWLNATDLKIEIPPALRAELQDRFREQNAKLFQFIGRDLGWNARYDSERIAGGT